LLEQVNVLNLTQMLTLCSSQKTDAPNVFAKSPLSFSVLLQKIKKNKKIETETEKKIMLQYL